MKYFQKTLKFLNIIFLSFLLIIFLFTLISQFTIGYAGKVNFSIICRVVLFSLFCISLIKYIRINAIGWHNYFLGIVWLIIGFVVIIVTIVYPIIPDVFKENFNYYELLADLLSKLQNLDRGDPNIDEEFIELLFEGTIYFNASLFIFIVLVILFLSIVYGIVFKRIYSTVDSFRSNSLFVLFSFLNYLLGILGLCFIGATYFVSVLGGDFIADIFYTYDNGVIGRDADIYFVDKIGNYYYLWEEIIAIIKKLNWNIYIVLLECFIFFLGIYFTVSKRFNLDFDKLLRQ